MNCKRPRPRRQRNSRARSRQEGHEESAPHRGRPPEWCWHLGGRPRPRTSSDEADL